MFLQIEHFTANSVSAISTIFPEDKNQIVKRYVYSGTSGAASLQQFVEQNIYHRQGEMNICNLDNILFLKIHQVPSH